MAVEKGTINALDVKVSRLNWDNGRLTANALKSTPVEKRDFSATVNESLCANVVDCYWKSPSDPSVKFGSLDHEGFGFGFYLGCINSMDCWVQRRRMFLIRVG
jgi:hypothetical protein